MAISKQKAPKVYFSPENKDYTVLETNNIPFGSINKPEAPLQLMSPILGSFKYAETDPVSWYFYQHKSDLHKTGLAEGNDLYAWDVNLKKNIDNGFPVYPVEAGEIVKWGNYSTGSKCGNVLIKHEENLYSGYLHMTNLQVKDGDIVIKNTIIGYISDLSCTKDKKGKKIPIPAYLHFAIYKGTQENSTYQLQSIDATFQKRPLFLKFRVGNTNLEESAILSMVAEETKMLRAITLLGEDAIDLTDPEFYNLTFWESSDKTIAFVSGNGKVTARKIGTAEISVKYGGEEKKIMLKVEQKRGTITVSVLATEDSNIGIAHHLVIESLFDSRKEDFPEVSEQLAISTKWGEKKAFLEGKYRVTVTRIRKDSPLPERGHTQEVQVSHGKNNKVVFKINNFISLNKIKLVAKAIDKNIRPKKEVAVKGDVLNGEILNLGQDVTYSNDREAPNNYSVGTNEESLKDKMRNLLYSFAKEDKDEVAKNLFDRFLEKNKGIEIFTSKTLNKAVEKNAHFIAFSELTLAAPGTEGTNPEKIRIHQALKNAQWDINKIGLIDDLGVPAFNVGKENYVFLTDDYVNGLKLMINGVQYVFVYVEEYKYDINKDKYKIRLKFVLYDVFGLDDGDLLEFGSSHNLDITGHPGFTAWWQLQHQFNYAPLLTKVIIYKDFVVSTRNQ